MTRSRDVPPALRRATRALRAQFFVAGALFATWGVHVPSLKAHYALGEQSLGIAMLASGFGAVVALLQAGRVLARHAPRAVVPVMAVACVAAIGSLLLTSSYGVLLGLMLVYGMAAAIFDVAINDEATAIEQHSGRPMMSGFHGMFSLGGMAGASAWGLLAPFGISPVAHLAGASAALGLLALGSSAFMLLQRRGANEGGAKGAERARAPLSLPRGPLALLGLLAALGLAGEGALYDWSVLYLRQELGSPAGFSSLGYVSFSAAMAAGRFGGDWVRARLDAVTLLRASGMLGALGMVLALAVPHPVVALAGFALTGLGFANIVPVLFSVAGQLPGIAPAHGIAAVSSLGYFGLMAGPPVIGFIAEGRSLAAGLLVVVVAGCVVTAFSRRALGPAAGQRGRPNSCAQ